MEPVLGFVPTIGLSGSAWFSAKRVAIVVTSRRAFLIPWSTAKGVLGPWLEGGVLQEGGAILTRAEFDPERWGMSSDVRTIPIESVTRVECIRVANMYVFEILFRTEKRLERLGGFLTPSFAYLRQSKKRGVASATAGFRYAADVGAVFRRALPTPSVVMWKL